MEIMAFLKSSPFLPEKPDFFFPDILLAFSFLLFNYNFRMSHSQQDTFFPLTSPGIVAGASSRTVAEARVVEVREDPEDGVQLAPGPRHPHQVSGLVGSEV